MAGDGLGVKAAIGRIAIFRAARLAQRERRHRRLGAIVGDGVDDAEARAAMRAIGEGIAEAALEGIGDLLRRRRGADRGVRRDLRYARRRRCSRQCGNRRADRRRRRVFRCDRSALAAAARSPGGAETRRSQLSRPPTRIRTPSASFRTSPASPSSRAIRQTVGRNPTPCTRPRTRISNRGEVSCCARQRWGSCRNLPKEHAVVAGIGDHERSPQAATPYGQQRLSRSARSSDSRPCLRKRAGQRARGPGAHREPVEVEAKEARIGRIGDDQALALHGRAHRACSSRRHRIVGAAIVIEPHESACPRTKSHGAPSRRGQLRQTMTRLFPASETKSAGVTAMPCGQRMPSAPAPRRRFRRAS